MHAEGVDDLIIHSQLGHKDIKTTYNCYCYDMTSDEERYKAITLAMTGIADMRRGPRNAWEEP